ncbi:MAG: HD domain-containing protein [Acidobacteria bacterium]|nr:HD domain-containing protein [Acidobacteriota bacterium]
MGTAVPIFLLALLEVARNDYGGKWILLTAITLITVPIFVFLPSVRSLVTIGDAFVISICMLYGKAPAILANALYFTLLTLLLRGKHQTSAHRVVFNIAVAVLTVGIYGSLYDFLNPNRSLSLEDIVIPTFVIAIAYFLTNSFLVATAIALTSQLKILHVWSKNYLGLSLDFLVSASAGALIVYFSNFHVIAPLLVAPFVAAIWGINKVNRAKALEAERHLRDQEQLYLRTVESLALAVDAKDPTTYGHIRRVRAYSMGLAKLCGITDSNELMAIETGSLLHDIGKLAIDDYILNKPGRLSHREFEKMKVHAAAGDEILRQIQFPFPVAEYVRSHHERWDGLGYPDGLRGEAIPIGARILAIADAFDAIRSSRPYKLSYSLEESINLLRSQAGTQYDPKLVDLFARNIGELERAAQEAVKDVPELSFRKYFERDGTDTSQTHPHIKTLGMISSTSEALVLLIEFCSSAARLLDLGDALPILATRLLQIIPASTCVFFLDSGDGKVEALYAAGQSADAFRGAAIGLGKGISGWVAAYRKPILNSNPRLDFQEARIENCETLTDALVVPMNSEEACLGAIALYSDRLNSFTPEHLDVMQNVATHITMVIHDAQQRLVTSDARFFTDPVTGTHRIVYLAATGSQLLSAAEKEQSPLSLLLFQISGLSQTIQLYGAPVCNAVLHKTAEVLKTELREIDILVRYGAHSFVALLPGVRFEQANRLSVRLTKAIRSSISPLIGSRHALPIDCHAVVAGYPGDGSTIYALLERAQRLLDQQDTSPISTEQKDRNILEFPPRL